MQIHTMHYEIDLGKIPEGSKPVRLPCLNDPFIKPAASFGACRFLGALAFQSIQSNGEHLPVDMFIHMKNSNDIRENVFKSNRFSSSWMVGAEKPEQVKVSNPKAFDKDTTGWMEGNGRILHEMTTNDVYITRPGDGAEIDLGINGHFIVTVLLYVAYENVGQAIYPKTSGDKAVVSFPLVTSRMQVDTGSWQNVYNGDPGFIPGAAYAIKAIDIAGPILYNGLYRITDLSTQAGLELILPIQLGLDGADLGQFIPEIVPVFLKQNLRIDMRGLTGITSAPQTPVKAFPLMALYIEMLTDTNGV